MSYKISPDIPDNLIESYLSESEIAVDTELHGLRLFRDEVCLVQICDDKNNVSLIKPENNQTPPNQGNTGGKGEPKGSPFLFYSNTGCHHHQIHEYS